MRIKPSFLSSKGAVIALAMLVGGSSGTLLLANTGVEENMIVAQTGRTVKGVVTDQNGEPLIGCNVVVVGSQEGVITDLDGRFSLKVSDGAKQLKVTYIGYVEQIVTIGSSPEIKITLKEDNNALEEVVVVGYGTQKKATLTGSIEQVSGKALESRAVTNVGLALQGQTPGLAVTRSSARPGNEDLKFQIRGATSVNGGDPLVIIDGVPALNGQSFQNMNADDIESISVLKDGAASIYGAKAANGVILVTTKKGKGKVSVDYNFNMRFNTNGITGFSPSMSEYAQMWLAANKEEKVPDWWAWVSQANMEKMAQGIEGIYPTQYYGDIFIGNANRLEEMFATRFSYQHNLSISGATDKSDFRISAAYADNQANLATAYDGQKQINLRLNYGYQLAKWIRLETGASLVNTDTESPSVGLDNSLYGNDMPFFPAKNPYGQWYANFGNVGDRQAVAATTDGGRDIKKSLTTRIDMKAIVDIWKGISFEGMASFQNEEFRRERWVTPVQTYDWFGNPAQQLVSSTVTGLNTTDPSNLDHNNPGYLTVAENYFYQYYSALLKYNKTFAGVHNVSALMGINAEKKQVKKLAAGRKDFENDGVYDLNLADGTLQGNSGGKYQNGTYSYIAKVNYDYAEKYLIELMGRRDGNSKFADGYRFQNYGSFSLGWVFTQENFIKPISSFIGLDFGKVRLSYGSSGNDAGLGNYDYVSTINQGTTILGSPAGTHISTSLNNSGLISLTRTWERVEQKNIGVDLNFLNNRLVFNWDYFIKDNKGMLSEVSYPALLGGRAPKTNSGHLRVRGWEVSLTWRDRIKDFSYYVTANVSDTRSKLMELEGANTIAAGKNKTLNGYPLNAYFLYKTDGYFQSQEEVNAYYAKYGNTGALASLPAGGSTELRPGDIKRLDLSGDRSISADGGASSDLIYMGDGNAHYLFGITLGGSWKGFDFNALFQGVGKQLIMRQGWMAYPFATRYTNQNFNFIGQTWTEDNPNAEFPRLTVYTERAKWNYENNDFMLQNNRYIRLKSLVVGYTLPQVWTRKAKLEKVRVYFSGNDLWEATSIKDGFDPEMGEMSQNSGYPFSRTWSFGINVGF